MANVEITIQMHPREYETLKSELQWIDGHLRGLFQLSQTPEISTRIRKLHLLMEDLFVMQNLDES